MATTKSKKTPNKTRGAARRRAGRARKKSAEPRVRLVPKLPERFEQVALLQKAVAELERREGDLNEALERLEGSYHDLVGRLGGLPNKTRDEAERRASELLGRVRESKAKEAFEELPDRALDELDELLDRVGLMRKARHEDELAKAKRRAKAAGKRAAKRELDKAAIAAEG